MILQRQQTYGRQSANLLASTRDPGIAGARALIETFYYAFNHKDMEAFSQVWAEDDLIQLNNPLGGIFRGYELIFALYQRIFSGPATVWVELHDIVEFQADHTVVFAGRETGQFIRNGESLDLNIRTSRIVQWMGAEIGWRQVHHHGSIDDPLLLHAYQAAVN